MRALAAVLLVLSSLVMAAHFFRGGIFAMALFVLLVPLLVLTRERRLIRVVQFLLLLGAAEWIRTALVIAQDRLRVGEPVTRMIVILGSVALFTALSAIPLSRVTSQ
jgi:hypothetical protein